MAQLALWPDSRPPDELEAVANLIEKNVIEPAISRGCVAVADEARREALRLRAEAATRRTDADR